MKITATELKNRLGRYLDAAETEPVEIQKSGRRKAVLLSHAQYQKLLDQREVGEVATTTIAQTPDVIQ